MVLNDVIKHKSEPNCYICFRLPKRVVFMDCKSSNIGSEM